LPGGGQHVGGVPSDPVAGQGLIPVAAGALAGALGTAPAMAIAGAATILAALALRRPLTRPPRVTAMTETCLQRANRDVPGAVTPPQPAMASAASAR
jgi:hypothetical protein